MAILLSHTFLYRAMISPFGLNILHVLYNLSDPGIVSGNEPETTQNLNIYIYLVSTYNYSAC